MTDKEYLQEAKEWLDHVKMLTGKTDNDLYWKRRNVLEWLIEKAEKGVTS